MPSPSVGHMLLRFLPEHAHPRLDPSLTHNPPGTSALSLSEGAQWTELTGRSLWSRSAVAACSALSLAILARYRLQSIADVHLFECHCFQKGYVVLLDRVELWVLMAGPAGMCRE